MKIPTIQVNVFRMVGEERSEQDCLSLRYKTKSKYDIDISPHIKEKPLLLWNITTQSIRSAESMFRQAFAIR